MIWIVLSVVIGCGVAAYIYHGRSSRIDSSQKPLALDAPSGMFIAASSESQARVDQALSRNGSEDRRDLLQAPKSSGFSSEPSEGFRPDAHTDWMVDVRFLRTSTLTNSEILQVFDRDWLKTCGQAMLYGRATTGRWTYVVAEDAPVAYSELALGWRLNKDFDADWKVPTSSEFEMYLTKVKKQCSLIGEAHLQPSLSPVDAAAKAAALANLKKRLGRDAVIVLQAPPDQPFEGRAIWDVMMSLGLAWGDMDLFHWPNETGEGGDYWFDVWTSTPPGYFFPEDIAAGAVKTSDLIFGFSIPRTISPVIVLESMLRAADYARGRLGGQFVSRTGLALQPGALKQEVESVSADLVAAGFPPGEHKTLYLF